MKGRHYGPIHVIQKAVTKELKFIPISTFKTAFRYWHSRWNCRVDAEGSYFEDY